MKKNVMEIAFIGVGLIGGSLAKALRKNLPESILTGVDENPAHIQTALELGIIDRKADVKNACSTVDIIIISIPVDKIPGVLNYVLDNCKESALITDTGSVKSTICRSVLTHRRRKNYVAAHPVAGTENNGPSASDGNLFAGKKNIICDEFLSDPLFVTKAAELFSLAGMINIFMDSISHDKHMACLSHLSHVLAYSLANTALDLESYETINDLAGSGFASTVRLAKSHAAMWTPIFLENRECVLEAISAFERNLKELKLLISGSNEEGISQYICIANRMREIIRKKELIVTV